MANPKLMNKHQCKTVVVTCIDFRFQPYIDRWLQSNFQPGDFDRISWAGSIRNLDPVLEQIGISQRLHRTEAAFLINHEDCGAYGAAGTPKRHAEDLKNAANSIKTKFPDLTVKTYYLHLDGTFESVFSSN